MRQSGVSNIWQAAVSSHGGFGRASFWFDSLCAVCTFGRLGIAVGDKSGPIGGRLRHTARLHAGRWHAGVTIENHAMQAMSRADRQ